MAGCDEDGVGPSRSESCITINGTRMKVGQAIHAKGTIVAKKGELEKIFGRNWKSGLGKKRKYRVESKRLTILMELVHQKRSPLMTRNHRMPLRKFVKATL